MKSIQLSLYPGGKEKAVTLSYDDGTIFDRRLVEIFNTYGLKGTFHLNSGVLDGDKRLTSCELRDLFKGHEISAHTVNHPNLNTLTPEGMAWQLLEDRRRLEALAGYPVRGISYPNGAFDSTVVARLPHYGIEYARTTLSHGKYHLPDNFLQWHPTCHHRDCLERAEEFLSLPLRRRLALFYVWGHSHEFERHQNWDLIERFAEKVAGAADSIWFATNIEIMDYINALKQVRVSVDGTLVQNLSHLPVWILVDGEPTVVQPGALENFG